LAFHVEGSLAFKDRVLMSICGAKRQEAGGDWGKLRNEERHVLYSSNITSDHIKEDRRGGSCGKYGRREYCI
jgi:hypothetical protein